MVIPMTGGHVRRGDRERPSAVGVPAVRSPASLEVHGHREAHARSERGNSQMPLRELVSDRKAIPKALAVARKELGVELVLLSDVSSRGDVVLWAAGDMSGLCVREGSSVPLEERLSRRMLGRGVTIVKDAGRDARTRDLEVVRRDGGVRAWIGVVLAGPEDTRYALCCLDDRPRPDLGEGDVHFLRGLGETIRLRLDGERADGVLHRWKVTDPRLTLRQEEAGHGVG